MMGAHPSQCLQVDHTSDLMARPLPAGKLRRYQSGDSFSYAIPGPAFTDFSGPGGEEARKGAP